jgi:hypothetical protein
MSQPMSLGSRVVHYHQPVGLSTLFRPLPKVRGVRPTLDVTYQSKPSGPFLRFSAKAALGIPEQTLLLVLMELAKQQFEAFADDVIVNDKTGSDIGRELWSKLNNGQSFKGEQTLRLETCWYELNRRCGSQTGGTTQAMRAAQLERLCEVIVWEHDGDDKKTRRQSNLVVWLVGDDERIHLALNCRLASAILGQPYSQVSLAERLTLKRDIPMALHAFLSTTIRHAHHLKIGLERLIDRLWPGSVDNAPANTHRSRRRAVHEGLAAIGRLDGWTVEWERDDMAIVKRLSTGVVDMTSHNANKKSSYRQQPLSIITNKNKGLATFDASGLFLTNKSSA